MLLTKSIFRFPCLEIPHSCPHCHHLNSSMEHKSHSFITDICFYTLSITWWPISKYIYINLLHCSLGSKHVGHSINVSQASNVRVICCCIVNSSKKCVWKQQAYTVSLDQEARKGLCLCLWLRVSHEGTVNLFGRTMVISKLGQKAGGFASKLARLVLHTFQLLVDCWTDGFRASPRYIGVW